MAKTITLLWSGANFDNAAVTVTGGSNYTFDGGAAAFPNALSLPKHVVGVSADGTHTVTVTWNGRTVYNSTFVLNGDQGVIVDVSPSVQQQMNAGQVEKSTTAALTAIGNAINTTNKYAGKPVLNTTTNVMLFATDGTAGGVWRTCAGVSTHTPA